MKFPVGLAEIKPNPARIKNINTLDIFIIELKPGVGLVSGENLEGELYVITCYRSAIRKPGISRFERLFGGL